MTYDITHLCAGCGREIDNDSFGLCAECEESIQQADCTDTARRAPTPITPTEDTP